MLETVIDGVTGCFWTGGAEELAQAVLEFDEEAVDPEVLVTHAQRFGRQAFREGLTREIEAARARDVRPGERGASPFPPPDWFGAPSGILTAR